MLAVRMLHEGTRTVSRPPRRGLVGSTSGRDANERVLGPGLSAGGGGARGSVEGMRVLVTGAAGFIGSHVAERLAPHHEVVGVDDLSTGDRDNLRGIPIRLVEGSILDPDAMADAMADVDAIVHLAARPSVPRSIDDPVASHEANTVGTMRVLEAARAAANDVQVIVASSSSVYGSNPTLPKHEALATLPVSPYAATKLATEQYALAWQKSFGMRTLALRFFNVFGPRQAPGHAYAAVVPAFVYAALLGELLTVHGDGSQTRDFTYVGTVSDVIVDAVERGVSHDTPVNLAFGTRTSLLEVIDRLGDMIDRPIERQHVPTRAGDVPHSQADNSLLRSLFTIDAVDLDTGLQATVDWMRRYIAEHATTAR